MTKNNPLHEIIPADYLRLMAAAIDYGRLGAVIVVGHAELETMNAGKVALLDVERLGVIILLPQSALEAEGERP